MKILISNITLSEFTTDLQLDLEINNKKLLNQPDGIFSIANSKNIGINKGVIFLFRSLRNDNSDMNILDPYYLVYISKDGKVKMTHDNSIEILKIYKSIANKQNFIDQDLVNQFNEETNYGKNMQLYVSLLNKSLDSINNKNIEHDLQRLFDSDKYMKSNENNEFILISFLIIK